jgi:hypothetical protein
MDVRADAVVLVVDGAEAPHVVERLFGAVPKAAVQ